MGWLWGSKGKGGQVISIDDTDSPYTVLSNDHTILCNCSSGAITVDLPAIALSTNRIIQVKKTDTSANAVTIDGSGSETIDDELTAVFAIHNTCLTLHASTQWNVT